MIILYLILFVTIIHGRPVIDTTDLLSENDDPDKVMETISMNEILDFLTDYGYLAEKRPDRANGTSIKQRNYTAVDTSGGFHFQQKEITEALKEFQKFMGIKVTGQLNVETIKYMRKPRCGKKDRVPRDILSFDSMVTLTAKGKAKQYAYSMSSFSKNTFSASKKFDWALDTWNLPSKIAANYVNYGFQYALNRWAAVCNVQFERVASINNADIVVSFFSGDHGDGKNFDGPGGSMGHASSKNYQVHFDKDESFQVSAQDSFNFVRPNGPPDFVYVAIHEIGHLLGFGHSTNKDSVMFPTIPSSFTAGEIYRLHDTDIADAKSSYGKCWPAKIDSMFSNLRNGKTYISINYFTYEIDDPKLQVAQSWPRLTYATFRGFDKVDEFFFHKGRVFMIKGGYYRFEFAGAYSPWYKTSQKFHPSLTSVDAAFVHTDGKLYLIKKDLVYRWDDNLDTPPPNTYPDGNLEAGWPKKLQDVFPGAPESPDTVNRWYYDGRVYFFKDRYFQEFDPVNKTMKKVYYDTAQWKNVCDSYLCNSPGSCYHWNTA